jgi:hypothetical protein
METEMIQTVLTELVEELKELEQRDAKMMAIICDLNNKVDDFELKLTNIQVICLVFMMSMLPTNNEIHGWFCPAHLLFEQLLYFHHDPAVPIRFVENANNMMQYMEKVKTRNK